MHETYSLSFGMISSVQFKVHTSLDWESDFIRSSIVAAGILTSSSIVVIAFGFSRAIFNRLFVFATDFRKRFTQLIFLKHFWHNFVVNFSFRLTWKFINVNWTHRAKMPSTHSPAIQHIWISFRTARIQCADFSPKYPICDGRRSHTDDIAKMRPFFDFSPFYFQFCRAENQLSRARCWT